VSGTRVALLPCFTGVLSCLPPRAPPTPSALFTSSCCWSSCCCCSTPASQCNLRGVSNTRRLAGLYPLRACVVTCAIGVTLGALSASNLTGCPNGLGSLLWYLAVALHSMVWTAASAVEALAAAPGGGAHAGLPAVEPHRALFVVQAAFQPQVGYGGVCYCSFCSLVF
jgi:hypothetical protein